MTRDLTTGSPVKRIVAFCLPLMAGSLFQQFYNLADSMIVGRLIGVDAFAAVGSTGSLSFLVLGFALGLCSGFSIPIARAFGAGDIKLMKKHFAQSVYLALFFSALITASMFFFTRPLLTLMKTPADIFEDAYKYIFIIFMGVGATVFYNLLACVLRAVGDSRTPLFFLVVACVINVLLDILFIAAFGAGVEGAAYATVIAQLLSGGFCLVYIRRNITVLYLQKSDMPFDRHSAAELLGTGVPMGLQFSITAVGSIVLQSSVNGLGSATVAAVSAASKVQLLVTSPMETLGLTMATFCGQNLGAGKIERIRDGMKKILLLGLGYCVAAFCTVYFAGTWIARMFISGSETAILSDVHRFLAVGGALFPFLLLIFVFRNALQGLGHSNSAMLAGVFEMAARTFVAFRLIGVLGYDGVCLANPAAWFAGDLLLLPLYAVVMHRLVKTEKAGAVPCARKALIKH